MNYTVLRRLIREMLLQEQGSVDPTAKAMGLAVCRINQSGEDLVIIYDPQKFKEVSGVEEVSEATPWKVRRSIIIKLAKTSIRSGVTYRMNSNCNDSASIVQSVSSRGGWGPAAYEVAMWDLSQRGLSLTSDRKNVSPEAANVWMKYSNRSDRVSKNPFDDIDDPKTPPTRDDCRLHGLDYLDHSYSLNSEPAGLSSMEAAHDAMIDWATGVWGSSGKDNLEFLLQDAMIDLFSQEYSG